MHLKSTTGPINVLVLNQDEDVTTSVMVPTPKCPRTSNKHTHARQVGEFSTDTQTEQGSDRPVEPVQGLAEQVRRGEQASEESAGEMQDESCGRRSGAKQQVSEVTPVATEMESGGRRLRSGRITKPISSESLSQVVEHQETESPLPKETESKPPQGPVTETASGTPPQQRSLAAIVQRLHKDNEVRGGAEGEGRASEQGEHSLQRALLEKDWL